MTNGSERREKDGWDKLSALSGFLAAVFVPIALAFVGNWYTSAIKEREAEISDRDQKIRADTFKREWVQLGLEILRDPNTETEVKDWGVGLINHYADVKMAKKVQDALTSGGAVLPNSASLSLTSETTQTSQTSRVKQMDALQSRGIEALLNQDLQSAVAAYDEAYDLWPTFRNVDEIRRILRAQAASGAVIDWTKTYREIDAMDLRGVDMALRSRLDGKAAE